MSYPTFTISDFGCVEEGIDLETGYTFFGNPTPVVRLYGGKRPQDNVDVPVLFTLQPNLRHEWEEARNSGRTFRMVSCEIKDGHLIVRSRAREFDRIIVLIRIPIQPYATLEFTGRPKPYDADRFEDFPGDIIESTSEITQEGHRGRGRQLFVIVESGYIFRIASVPYGNMRRNRTMLGVSLRKGELITAGSMEELDRRIDGL